MSYLKCFKTVKNIKFVIFRDSIFRDGGGRQNSMEENLSNNLDQFLKTSNYEDTVKQLDIYYGMGEFLENHLPRLYNFEFRKKSLDFFGSDSKREPQKPLASN